MKVKSILDRKSNFHFIPIPKEIGEKLIAKFGKRVLCIVNGKGKLHCALRTSKVYGYTITVGKTSKAKIQANFGDTLNLEFRRDKSPFQFDLPEAMQEVLASDPDGAAAFQLISDGKKRSAIHLVSSAKRIETRINRALKIIENIKNGITDPKAFLK